MYVECNGRVYDHRDMICIPVNERLLWKICIPRDCDGAVLMEVDRHVGLMTREATDAEIMELADRFPLPELHRVRQRLHVPSGVSRTAATER